MYAPSERPHGWGAKHSRLLRRHTVVLSGVLVITLVVLAFHTGLDLVTQGVVTQGVPADSFAGRLISATGLR